MSAPKRRLEIEVGWTANSAGDPKLGGFRIYAALDGTRAALYTKGTLVGSAGPKDRVAKLQIEEGRYIFRVIPHTLDGLELHPSRHKRAVIDVSPSKIPAPAQPTDAQAAATDATAPVKVTTDPPSGSDTAASVELVEGPDEFRGKLVSEQPVQHGGQDTGAGVRINGSPVLLPGQGYGFSDDRSLHVLHRGQGFRRSPATAVAAFMPDMDDAGLVEVASAVANGSTWTPDQLAAPSSTDPWESDATDGIRMRAIPTCGAAGAEWQSCSTGLLVGVPSLAKYLNRAEIVTNEITLAARTRGVLDIHDTWQRKSALMATVPAMNLKGIPSIPSQDPRVTGTAMGPLWLACAGRQDGRPTRPLSAPKWFVRWNRSNATISMDYVPYTPGMIIDAHRVQCKCVAEEPTGLWQMICPEFYIRLRPKFQRRWGTATIPAGVGTVTVTLSAAEMDRRTGVTPFPNSSCVLFVPSNYSGADVHLYLAANQLGTGTPTFTANAVNPATGANAAGVVTFHWFAIGY